MTSEKARIGRPPIGNPTYVQKVAAEMVRQWALDNPRELKAALLKNPNYLATIDKSERTLIFSALVRHALVVEKWIEANMKPGHTPPPEIIAYQMYLAARPNRSAHAKSYAKEESDPSWARATMLRVQAYRHGSGVCLYFWHYQQYVNAASRLRGEAVPLDMSKAATNKKEKKVRERKLLPFEDVHGEDDWI